MASKLRTVSWVLLAIIGVLVLLVSCLSAQLARLRVQSCAARCEVSLPPRSVGISSVVITVPGAVTVRRRVALTSCRTLPGQS